MRGSFCKLVTVFEVVPGEAATVLELTTDSKTGRVSEDGLVFNSKAVPVARKNFAERFEVV